MKVTREIDVTPSEYFDHLCEGAIKDIKKATSKKASVEQLIDGYSYNRKVKYKKRDLNFHFTVGPLIKDKYFEVRYETDDTSCLYYYDFSSKDGKNYVTYCEDNKYKKESVGNYLSNMKRQLQANRLKKSIYNNIEMTLLYIKNHRKQEEKQDG